MYICYLQSRAVLFVYYIDLKIHFFSTVTLKRWANLKHTNFFTNSIRVNFSAPEFCYRMSILIYVIYKFFMLLRFVIVSTCGTWNFIVICKKYNVTTLYIHTYVCMYIHIHTNVMCIYMYIYTHYVHCKKFR